ncbi:MAG: HEAT repeat domain-containing protein [Kiritimatiellia bacterium]|jgi:hypothetical protein|nr:HEAT repeat domain-containing protein [Kiritimatiellia bacterium]
MMAMGIMPLLMALMMSQNMGGDLLDYIPSADYWHYKDVEVTEVAMLMELGGGEEGDAAKLVQQLGSSKYKTREAATAQLRKMGARALPALREAAASNDVEVSSRARELIKNMPGESGKSGEVRRLMAIRTLGELKSEKALPALQQFADSKELFVADYAMAAVSDIKKGSHERPGISREWLERDLACLPAACALVAQSTVGKTRPESAGGWLNEMDRTMTTFSAQMGGTPPNFRAEVVKGFLGVVEKIGNVRLQSITVGVDGAIGDQKGFMLMIARGAFDSAAVKKWMLQSGMHATTRNGIEFFSPEDEVLFSLVSNDTLVFIAGANPAELPGAEVVRALTTKSPRMQLKKKVAELVSKVDRNSATWAIASITDSYRQVPFTEPFDTATLTVDHKDEGTGLTLTATGKDAERVKASVDTMRAKQQESLAELKKQMAMAGPMAEMMKSAQKLMEGIKFDLDGQTATVTMTVSDDEGGIMSMPMMWMGMMIPVQQRMQMHEEDFEALPPVEIGDPIME